MNAHLLKTFSNEQLLSDLERQFDQERKTSHVILLYLKEIQTRKLYADRGYSSLFAMLIGYFHQSESAANQRLKAIELMTDVPQVEDHLKNGELNLSTLAMAQRQIRREEKVTGLKVSPEKKREIVELISNKTMVQAEIELMRLLPESSSLPETHERRVSESATRLSLTLPNELREKLIRLKDLWAHVDPTMDFVQIINRAASLALEKEDPARKTLRKSPKPQSKTESEVSNQRPSYYSVLTDKILWERANSRCEYIDSISGHRCDCRFGLERDHILPLAMGGTNELSNLRLLCKTHNLLMARRHFGEENIEKMIRNRTSQAY